MAEILPARDDGKVKFAVWHDGKKEELDGVLDYLIKRDGPDREHWSLTPPPPTTNVEAWFDGTKLPPAETPPAPAPATGAAPVPPPPPPPAKPEITRHTISRTTWEEIQRGKEAELWSLEEPEGYAAQEEAKAKAKEPKPREAKPAPHEDHPAPQQAHRAPPPPPPPPARGHR